MAGSDKRDAQRTRLQELFLNALKGNPSVTQAAAAAGVSRQTVYRWREEVPEFGNAWDDVREASIERLEQALYERAVDSSDQAAFFLLKALKPETYRERQTVEHTGAGGGAVKVEHSHDLSKLSADRIRELRSILAEATPDAPA